MTVRHISHTKKAYTQNDLTWDSIRVRFEPERTGTPFLFFFITGTPFRSFSAYSCKILIKAIMNNIHFVCLQCLHSFLVNYFASGFT